MWQYQSQQHYPTTRFNPIMGQLPLSLEGAVVLAQVAALEKRLTQQETLQMARHKTLGPVQTMGPLAETSMRQVSI